MINIDTDWDGMNTWTDDYLDMVSDVIHASLDMMHLLHARSKSDKNRAVYARSIKYWTERISWIVDEYMTRIEEERV